MGEVRKLGKRMKDEVKSRQSWAANPTATPFVGWVSWTAAGLFLLPGWLQDYLRDGRRRRQVLAEALSLGKKQMARAVHAYPGCTGRIRKNGVIELPGPTPTPAQQNDAI